MGAYNSSSGTSSIVITTGGTTADVTRSASDTGGLKITESWSRNITTPSAVVTRFRSGAWHEKPIPANPIIHSNNANLIKELSARYNGPETDGQTATGYKFDPALTTSTTLSGAITATQTSITVASSAGFPAVPFTVQCQSEWIMVSAISGTTWTIKRGLDSVRGPAASHASGSQIQYGRPYLEFTGGFGSTSNFAVPVFNVTTADPNWILTNTGNSSGVPPQFLAGGQGVRIPTVAQAHFAGGASSDSPLVIYDAQRGYYASFAKISWTGSTWDITSGGAGGVMYLSSYGIDSGKKTQTGSVSTPSQWPATLPGSGVNPATYQDDIRNVGIRGNHAGFKTVDFTRLTNEDLMAYCIEGFCIRTANTGVQVFPMTGTENLKGGLIREGTRCHIKWSIDVTAKLNARASAQGWSAQRLAENLAIAKGLQKYGVYWGDTAGATGSIIKMDALQYKYPAASPPTGANAWQARSGDLAAFPFDTDWEFTEAGYDPP